MIKTRNSAIFSVIIGLLAVTHAARAEYFIRHNQDAPAAQNTEKLPTPPRLFNDPRTSNQPHVYVPPVLLAPKKTAPAPSAPPQDETLLNGQTGYEIYLQSQLGKCTSEDMKSLKNLKSIKKLLSPVRDDERAHSRPKLTEEETNKLLKIKQEMKNHSGDESYWRERTELQFRCGPALEKEEEAKLAAKSKPPYQSKSRPKKQ